VHLAAVRWACELDEERVWAIEHCRACSRGLEQTLLAAGERVARVGDLPLYPRVGGSLGQWKLGPTKDSWIRFSYAN
jgi:hypothetical protein